MSSCNDLDLHHNDVMFDVHKTSMAHIITDLPGESEQKKDVDVSF